MAVSDSQLEIIGRSIDRLVTVEARISDYSRGVIANLHRAACEAQGGGPLSLLAARHILKHVGPGKVVLMTTGAGDPRFLPAGETDGPMDGEVVNGASEREGAFASAEGSSVDSPEAEAQDLPHFWCAARSALPRAAMVPGPSALIVHADPRTTGAPPLAAPNPDCEAGRRP